MSPRIAIVIYTMYQHVGNMAQAVKQGIESAGGKAQIFQVAETLSPEVLDKLKAPPKPNFPVLAPAALKDYDAFLFGIPTRFGNMPAQWKAFWDQTGGIWFNQELSGKYAGVFVSTDTPGGGQEVTAMNFLSTLTHHGIIYVPLGYKGVSAELMNLSEVHGGSPWGAGTYAGGGTRNPTALEIEIAKKQGQKFFETVSKINFN
ncbi:flavodoxin-like fold protein [Leucoagaricus gongylophorus]